MIYVQMIETRTLKILLKSFHENYSDLFKKQHGISMNSIIFVIYILYIVRWGEAKIERSRDILAQ